MRKFASQGASLMSTILSFAEALEEMYEHMHWRASGPNYYGDHLLYERLYEDIDDEVDLLAEKAVGIFGSDTIGPNKTVEETAHITKNLISDDASSDEFPNLAIDAEKKFIKVVSEALKVMSEDDEATDGIDNLLQGVVDKHEEHLYLLQQRAGKKEAGVVTNLFKLAYYLDRKALYNEAKEIERVMQQLAERVGIDTEELVSLADHFDQIGDTATANAIDHVIKEAAGKTKDSNE